MYKHPGVYIEHVPSGVLSIEAASTSVAAFIGAVKRGDLVTANKGEPVFISGASQYTRLFGELKGGAGGIRDEGASPDYFGHAVGAFFANGGNKAYIVPVGNGNGTEALADFANPLDPSKAFYFNAKSEGAWANGLVVEMKPDVEIETAPNSGLIDFSKSTFRVTLGLLNAKGDFDPVLERFDGLSLDHTSPQFVVAKINSGSLLAEVKHQTIGSQGAGQTTALLSPSLTSLDLSATLVGGDTIAVVVDTETVNVPLSGQASLQAVAAKIQSEVRNGAVAPSPRVGFVAQVTPDGRLLLRSGSSGATSKVVVLGGATAAKLGLDPTAFFGQTPTAPTAPAGAFGTALNGKKIKVKLGSKADVECVFASPADGDLAAVAVNILNKLSAAGANTNTAFVAKVVGGKLMLHVPGDNGTDAVSVLAPAADDGRALLGLDNNAASTAFRPGPLPYPLAFDATAKRARATFAGGNDHGAPNGAAYIAALERLRDYRDISILLLPGKTWKTDSATIEAAVTHAEFMQNRMVIVDPAASVKLETPKDVFDLGAPTSPYTALYYPWLEVANPHYDKDTAANKPKTFPIPPSAFAAGMWSRIDGSRGVWKAPAGLEATVRGSLGPTVLIGNDLQDNLNEWGVNCLRAIIGPTVIWGARTLATKVKPEFRYVPVRRTQSMIGESLYSALQAVVFEPNDYKLWSSLRASVGTFMDGLHRAGAFQGEKASDAYYVLCGLGATMTQGDIDSGIVRVVVGFAPLKPAEFVVVQIQQIVGRAA